MPSRHRGSSSLAGDVLIAGADGSACDEVVRTFLDQGVHCVRVGTMTEALALLETSPFDVVIADGSLADDVVTALRTRWPTLPVIVTSSDTSVPRVVSAMNAGAADFLAKPFAHEDVIFAVKKALELSARTIDVPPPPTGTSEERDSALFGASAVMQEALAVLERAAPGIATILVRGESGTGKELIARAIHARSPRKPGPFVKIDCASLPDQLLESELFGYEKGAFTGAAGRKLGRVELAEGGTLFLDEIGELTAALQAKLLRLLQDRELERLGGTKTIQVDVRVVAATHRDLETMVERGQFRQDLFYRLNVVPLWLPPLRARRDDVELLARHFCAIAGAANGKPNSELDALALKLLRRQRWPGNVRQLQNFIERLVVLSAKNVIGDEDVRAELDRQVKFVTQSPTTTLSHAPSRTSVLPLSDEMRAAEKNALERALRLANGKRSHAARLLGISRSTLYAKLAEYGLDE